VWSALAALGQLLHSSVHNMAVMLAIQKCWKLEKPMTKLLFLCNMSKILKKTKRVEFPWLQTPPTSTSVFFWGEKFRPKKYDFNLLKGFSMEKMAQIRQISKKKKKKGFQIAKFLW
jgi:hypothetical protein